jgi:putative salt-induced outer membrane protein YdiY
MCGIRLRNLPPLVLSAIVAVVLSASASAQTDPRLGGETSEVLADWIQIYSQEWLKGRFHGMYDRQLEFDSTEFDVKSWDWDDIVQLRTMDAVEVGLITGETIVGRIAINRNDVIVMVSGKPLKLTRADIITISPIASSRSFFKRWFVKVDAGVTILTGNTDENDFNVSGRVKRQSAKDRVIADYIANVSNSNNQKISNNQRLRFNWDRFLTARFYIKPLNAEWYSDPFQNITARTTAGAGAGYQILTTTRTKWEASGGIGYQRTRFANVEEGATQDSSTGAFSGSTHFEQKWTKTVKFTYEYTFNVVNQASGRYNHHMYGLIETKWMKAIDLDVTLVWDRTQYPKPGADGTVPKPDDFRMVVSLGIDF